MKPVEIHPLVRQIIAELRRRGLDVEYRGHANQLHLTGNMDNADQAVIDTLKNNACKRRLLEVLKPLFADGDGSPVRLPAETIERPEPVHRGVPALCGRGVPVH